MTNNLQDISDDIPTRFFKLEAKCKRSLQTLNFCWLQKASLACLGIEEIIRNSIIVHYHLNKEVTW